jgi:hypothetical protein
MVSAFGGQARSADLAVGLLRVLFQGEGWGVAGGEAARFVWCGWLQSGVVAV